MTTLTGTTRATKRVLIVDDDAAVVQVLHDALGLFRHDHAYSVEIARDGAEGFAALERAEFDLVLLDMPNGLVSAGDARLSTPPGGGSS